MSEPVLLLHGIWLRALTLLPLSRRLARAGFAPRRFDYWSVLTGAEAAAPKLAARIRLQGEGPVHLVGHSLGGLLAIETVRRYPDLPVRRIVCIGSPLAGSGTAAALAGRGGLGRVLGRSRPLLLRGCGELPPELQVGVIAGDLPIGLGAAFARFPGPHDGTVSVEETRVPGLTDHIVLRASHTGLLLSRAAAHQAAVFLRHGRFDARPEDRG